MNRKFIALITSAIMLAIPTVSLAAADNPAGTTLDELAAGDSMTTNNGTVTKNHGEIHNNRGTVADNTVQGLIEFNHSSVTTNSAGGTVAINYRTVETNKGIVATNGGTIDVNEGTVTRNERTVSYNAAGGMVAANDGRVAMNESTVADNNGTVGYNAAGGKVITNSAGGEINRNFGTVTTNNGTVTDNYGTITTNNGTVINNYGTIINDTAANNSGLLTGGAVTGGAVTNQYHKVNVSGNVTIEGLHEANGSLWVKEGEDVSFSINPDAGRYIDGALSVTGGVAVTDNGGGSYTLSGAAGEITLSVNTQLYTYNVSYDANGAEGVMAAQTFTHGVAQELAANTFIREGYTFAGWNTAADGSGVSYSDREAVSVTGATTLYARWTQNPADGDNNNGGGAGTAETTSPKTGDEGAVRLIKEIAKRA